MMTALLVAHGVPMICMGDEYGHTWVGWGQAGVGQQGLVVWTSWRAGPSWHGRPGMLCALCAPPTHPPLLPCPARSKGGNNNTYCHDSALNYLDWQRALADDDGLLRFTRHVIALRRVPRRPAWRPSPPARSVGVACGWEGHGRAPLTWQPVPWLDVPAPLPRLPPHVLLPPALPPQEGTSRAAPHRVDQ